jgi:signal transduction histidine kinase
VISKAARERQAVVIDDVASSPIFMADPALPASKSEVALPMLVSGQLIGVLDLQSRQTQRFTADDLRVFQTLADQIAVSIRNSQLFSETIIAREEAERSNQVKSAFLASMSHELRTPLNAIINFTKFVARGVMGPVNEKQVNTLKSVIDGGEHLLALINDVLDISKIESGSLNLFVQDVNMNEILATAEKTAQSLLADKPVTFVQDAAPALPKLMGDQQRILQVVLNIVSNACKFTREGEIRVTASATSDEMLVSVSDTGPGIDPEDYEAVFEKFKQTETGLRQGGGTGLGMPISRSLIEAHGGRMWIEGAKGQGATFKFTLPLQAKIDPRIVTLES